MSEKAKLTVVLEPPEAERIKAAAKGAGLSASEFSRRALLQHLDAPKPEETPRLRPIPTLNASARTDGVLVPTPPPAPMRPVEDYVPTHPCSNLRPVFQPPYDKTTCQGSCADPRQNGRPCFWGAPAASQCPMFAPKVRVFPAPQSA